MQEVDQQLEELQDTLSDIAKQIGKEIDKFCEMMNNLFPEVNEVDLYSEKELKKRIKYSKTPMERKRWQDILQEKYKNKRRNKK